jgi:hypothetical protein
MKIRIPIPFTSPKIELKSHDPASPPPANGAWQTSFGPIPLKLKRIAATAIPPRAATALSMIPPPPFAAGSPNEAQRINELAHQVANRTRLSTTGYQLAMERLNSPERSDEASLMTLSRAKQYTEAAKLAYPSETLKHLANLQQSQIYRTASGELRGAVEMSPKELTHCVQQCRATGFSNCDIQALEVALELRHQLGISNFSIVSNEKLSHNYVVIHPSDTFPKGAIVDSWTGQGIQELNFKTKMKFRHFESNYRVNANMHEWLEKYGLQHAPP